MLKIPLVCKMKVILMEWKSLILKLFIQSILNKLQLLLLRTIIKIFLKKNLKSRRKFLKKVILTVNHVFLFAQISNKINMIMIPFMKVSLFLPLEPICSLFIRMREVN